MKKAALFISVMIIFMIFPSYKAECISYENIIEDVLKYRGNVSEYAGSTDGDWCAFVYGRYYGDNSDYLHNLSENVYQRYQTEQKLSRSKSTEWHRIILTVLACGGNPFDVRGINLLEDGVYNRGKTVSLGRQGLNGWIWGLISLDAAETDIPDGSFYSREDIILEILKQQNSDGGFSLYGETSDTDITANAITALSKYYTDNTIYNYVNQKTNQSIAKSVKVILDEALAFLSESQLSDGGYASGGTENCESASQVLLALCTMGIDPLTDERYIKNGNTIIDNVISFKNDDGGFSHVKGMPSNPYASDQAAIGIAAVDRLIKNDSGIFSFSLENSEYLPTEPTDVPVITKEATYIETSMNSFNKTDVYYEFTSVAEAENNSYNYAYGFYQSPSSEARLTSLYNLTNTRPSTVISVDRNVYSRRSVEISATASSDKTYETTVAVFGKKESDGNNKYKFMYIIVPSVIAAGAGFYAAVRRRLVFGKNK